MQGKMQWETKAQDIDLKDYLSTRKQKSISLLFHFDLIWQPHFILTSQEITVQFFYGIVLDVKSPIYVLHVLLQNRTELTFIGFA